MLSPWSLLLVTFSALVVAVVLWKTSTTSSAKAEGAASRVIQRKGGLGSRHKEISKIANHDAGPVKSKLILNTTPYKNLVSKRFVMELSGLTGDSRSGKVILETRPDWAPIGVEHFHELVGAGYYDQCRFFRVLPKFVVQFGIAATPEHAKAFKGKVLIDDSVVESNRRGTITYATSGKNTRTTQLFINTVHNKYLDQEGFAPFAQIVEGMDWIDKINDEYKEKPNQGKIEHRGNDYLTAEFPNLSYIVTLREDKTTSSLEK